MPLISPLMPAPLYLLIPVNLILSEQEFKTYWQNGRTEISPIQNGLLVLV